jgi:hypothetical protein
LPDLELQEAGTAELEVLRSELANAVRKATAAVVAAEEAEDRAKAAEEARAQVARTVWKME